MKDHSPADIRNIALIGHASCGKTTLSEAMLACAGAIQQMGNVAAGTTVSDYQETERKRQFSVSASLLHCQWLERKFNLLDCPGYADFLSESLGALRVADLALLVVHAVQGPGSGSDAAWSHAGRAGLPKMIVVNGCDKPEADFERVLGQIREHFGPTVFPITLPVNPGPSFNQVLDVPRSEIITYQADRSGRFSETPAAGPWAVRVKELHRELIEHIAGSQDGLLEKFLSQGGLSEDEWRTGIHQAIQTQVFIPLFCTSAQANVGVARLMDIIAKYGASPVDRNQMAAGHPDGRETKVAPTDPDPVCQVFKTLSEAQFGELSFLRVHSGRIKFGSELYNPTRGGTEKIGQCYLLTGKTRKAVPELCAGDIGAVVKVKHTHTGDTLCAASRPVLLPGVEYPKPNIHAALHSLAPGEEDKIAAGLAALHREDPAFLFQVDDELHQTLLSAQGELHLEVVVERLRHRHNVHVELIEPRVRYRETIQTPAEARHRHKKQTGGAGQFAEVCLRLEPKQRDTGIEFTQSLVGQNVDRAFVPSVEKGAARACQEGILTGHRVVDVRIDFFDGKMHPVDSKDIAFQSAGYFAFREAFSAANPCLLEPVHSVEVRIPEEFLGRVMGDLSSRRGRIQGIDTEAGVQVLKARVPAKELYLYASKLRSLTGGRGTHTETFSHYEEAPRQQQAKIIEDYLRSRTETKHP